jgi:hypothetical protein
VLPEVGVQSSFLRILASVAFIATLGGCATTPTRVTSSSPPVAPRGIVVVVDGAGGSPDAANSLTALVKETGTPLAIRSFAWSHGLGLGVLDMTDVEHSRESGRRLAFKIAAYRQSGLPIYIVAYSAGAHVALEATRLLEPNSLERIVLLAPAVAADYDLGPALASARQGVDVFTSSRDRLYLGLGTRVTGTADGKAGVAPAGRVGFDPPADGELAGRLRQHPWDSSIAWTGNNGNHSGTVGRTYLRAFILPLITPP